MYQNIRDLSNECKMREFPFQYNLPDSVVPFSIVKGGISMLQSDVCDQLRPVTPVNSVGEINWLLKDHHTDQVFSARQTHNHIRGNVMPALHSQQRLVSGNRYETLKVTSPAPQVSNLHKPEETSLGTSPSVGLAQGTHIMTEHGEIPIENLRPGLRLITRDHGMKKLLWVGATRDKQRASPLVRFRKGAINNCRDLLVCANQHIVLKGAEALMRFGKREVFAKAETFVDHGSIDFEPKQQQTFYQLLMETHEVIYAEASACESFLPSASNLTVLPLSARLDIHLMLPELQSNPASFGPMARSHVKIMAR